MDNRQKNNRTHEGIFAGFVGITCNLILSAVKFVIGFFTGSISIQADAVNNLSDCASSLTSLIGFKMASKAADKEHPFGHGRIEYVAGLVVSFLVIAVSFEFFKSSIARIIAPEPIQYRLSLLVILIISIFVKLAMGLYYMKVSKKIDSVAVKASAFDSFSDMAVTSVTVLAFALSPVTNIPIDGIAGILVALFIFIGGIKMIKETLNPLIGRSPDQKTTDDIISILNRYDQILGVHDLMVHDYGPGKILASVHAEVPMGLSFHSAHSLIDRAETDIKNECGISIVIHGDPVATMDPALQRIRSLLRSILRSIDPAMAYHDLRLEKEDGGTVIYFDLVIPYSRGAEISHLIQQVAQSLKETSGAIKVVITADRQ